MALPLRRVAAAALTLPPNDTKMTPTLVAAFSLLALLFGTATGFLKLRRARGGWATWASVVGVVALRGLAEEAVFRAALLPHPAVDAAALLTPVEFAKSAAASTAAFALAHLLLPGETNRNPGFLAIAAGLGAAMSAVFFVTKGSLLAVWAAHCIPVAVWLLLLGGAAREGFEKKKTPPAAK